LSSCLEQVDPRVKDAAELQGHDIHQSGDLDAALTQDVFMALLWAAAGRRRLRRRLRRPQGSTRQSSEGAWVL